MKRFLNAFRFLTIIPLPGGKHADLAEAGKSSACFPLVGLIIGALLMLTAWLCSLAWGALVQAAVVTALWVILTAGLHLDGLADLADGIGGGWDKESRLRIMKDSSIGTYGALAVGLLLLLKTVLLYELLNCSAALNAVNAAESLLTMDDAYAAILFAPASGRFVQVLSIRIFPPAKKEGFGQYFKSGVKTHDAVIAAILTTIVATAFWGWLGLCIVAAVVLFMLVTGKWVSSRLDGLNGDAYGAICELAELFTIAVISLIFSYGNGWLQWLTRL